MASKFLIIVFFRGEPSDLRHIPGVFHEILHGHSRGIIQLGLLVLIATPIVRVAFSIYAFARQHDKGYIGVTLLVLILLLTSLAGH